jgi:lipopolysaccharide export system permease protein
MDKITRYIGKTLLASIGLTLLLLVGLEFIFTLVNELRHIGTGDYSSMKALSFVLLSLPDEVAQMFPMAALVGCLLGLGILASRSELIVMRAAGMSILDIIGAVLKLAAVLVVLVWILGEWVAPLADKYAHSQKTVALSQGQALRTAHGIWMREGRDFVHIQSIENNHRLLGVTRYQFDSQMQLVKSSFAKSADYQDSHWMLHDIKETSFHDDSVKHQQFSEQEWQSYIDPQVLQVVGVKDLDELNLIGLWQAIKYRQQNGLDVRPYQLAFWQKIVRPFATLIMMFLAIPFVFGPLRSATLGIKMFFGVLVGFGFYTISQLFGPLTLVYQIPPIIGACLPALLFLGAGIFMLKRQKIS